MRLEQKYVIDKEKISWRIIDGEAIILNLDSGYYYSLNAVGTRIWQMIERGKELTEILNLLNEEYQIDKKILRDDLISLVKELEKEKLIK